MVSARLLTARLLVKMEGGSYSNIVLDNELNSSELSAQDKRFVSRLFYGVIERKITLDYIISIYIKKGSDKLDKEVKIALETGLYQLLFMPSVPDNAAVNESVKLTGELKKSSARGMVNAVLRNFLRDNKKYPLPKDKLMSMSVEYSCPKPLIELWLKDYGEEKTKEILEGTLRENTVSVRTNTLLTTTDSLLERFTSEGVSAHLSDKIKDCIILNSISGVENSDAYKEGLFHVQDVSSQLCCMALDPNENDIVLDVCSAPGGKAFTIAELMNDKGSLYAFDLHEKRVNLIKSGASRLKISCITAEASDATKYNDRIPMADKILCDVVCAGFGVIGKKPEIKYKNLSETERLPEIQYSILENSSRYLKAGGELVYSTCSLSKRENDEVIDKFLKLHDEFEGIPFLTEYGSVFKGYKATIFPSDFDSDGFFIAKIRRKK